MISADALGEEDNKGTAIQDVGVGDGDMGGEIEEHVGFDGDDGNNSGQMDDVSDGCDEGNDDQM